MTIYRDKLLGKKNQFGILKLVCKKFCGMQLKKPTLKNPPLYTNSDIVLQHICLKMAPTLGTFKNFWVTQIAEQQRFTRM